MRLKIKHKGGNCIPNENIKPSDDLILSANTGENENGFYEKVIVSNKCLCVMDVSLIKTGMTHLYDSASRIFNTCGQS